MMKTNRDRLIMQSAQGTIPGACWWGPVSAPDGKPLILPSVTGINYTVKLGDPAFGWVANHTKPGVAIEGAKGSALTAYACVGNEAVVVTGLGEGEKGIVTGKHREHEAGGADHVLLGFSDAALDKLRVGDSILVRTVGCGLQIEGHEDVRVLNLSPDVLERMDIQQTGDGLCAPVAAKVPGELMGYMIGMDRAPSFDMMTDEADVLRSKGLDRLRFGDFVLLEDTDAVYGKGSMTGACAVGLVVAGDCPTGGRGVSIMPVLACNTGGLSGRIDAHANLLRCLGGAK